MEKKATTKRNKNTKLFLKFELIFQKKNYFLFFIFFTF